MSVPPWQAGPPVTHVGRSCRVLALFVLAAALSACGSGSESGADIVHVPADAATIAAALEEVSEGGLVLISPGTYEESVTVEVPDVTIRGTDRNRVVIDAGGDHTDGVRVVADGVRLQNFTVINAVANGVVINGADNVSTRDDYANADDIEDVPLLDRFEVSNVTASNNGLYGIYAFHSSNGIIRDTYSSGSSDAGLYVGQCDDCNVTVEGNVAERNAIGFENANASGVTVIGNRFVGNRVGVTLTTDYREAFVPQRSNVVIGNLIAANVEPETPEHAQGGFGIGVGLAGAQENQIVRNRIVHHPVAGVIVSNAEDVPSSGNRFVANVFAANPHNVVDLAAERARSLDNCRLDEFAGDLDGDLGEQLCLDSTQPVFDADAVVQIAVPPGIPYFDVAPGPDQPGMAGPIEEVPDALTSPVAVELTTIAVPDRTLLADRASVRL